MSSMRLALLLWLTSLGAMSAAIAAEPETTPPSNAASPPKVYRLQIRPDPPVLKPGSALSPRALVQWPPAVRDVVSWTIESRRHRGPMYSMAVNHSGRLVATGGLDGTIRVWELATGKLLRVLVGHEWHVYTLAWSPDGSTIASGGASEAGVRLWDPRTGQQVRVFKGYRNHVSYLAWSPDGTQLIGAGGISGWVWHWNAETDNEQTLCEMGVPLYCVEWSPDSQWLAICGTQSPVWVIDVESGKAKRTMGNAADGYTAAAWSPDGLQLAVGCAGHTVIWELSAPPAREDPPSKKLPIGSSTIAWSPDGRQLALGYSGTIQLWDVAAWKPVLDEKAAAEQAAAEKAAAEKAAAEKAAAEKAAAEKAAAEKAAAEKTGDAKAPPKEKAAPEKPPAKPTPPKPPGPPKPLCTLPLTATRILWHPARQTLVGLSSLRVAVWDMTQPAPPPILDLDAAGQTPPQWTPGRPVVTGVGTKDLKVWDAATAKFLCKVHDNTPMTNVAWPRAKVLATSGAGNLINLWDTRTGEHTATIEGRKGTITAMAWSGDGKLLAAAGSDFVIRLWDADGESQGALVGHSGVIKALAWGTAGSTLISGGDDKTVRVWNAKTQQMQRSSNVGRIVTTLASTTVNKQLIVACGTSPDHIVVFNAAGQPMTTLKYGAHHAPTAMCWMPVPGMLMTGWSGHALHVWDVAAGKIVRTLASYAPVHYVSYTAGGAVLLAGNGDRTVRLWDAHGTLRGVLLDEGEYLAMVSAEGYWRTDPDVEADLLIIAQHSQGQVMLTPEQFTAQYRWKNNPAVVRLAPR